MNLKHVQSGQPLRIPASDWNAIINATRAHYEQQVNVASSKPASLGGQSTGIVYVKNASGADHERFAVLGIDAPIILPDESSGGHEEEFKRQVALSCVVPVVPTHTGRFVILAEPLADGAIGRAYIDGVCVVRLRVPNNLNTGMQADIVDGDSTVLELKAGNSGGQVIWREEVTTSPGECWAIVRLGPATRDGYWARIYGSADQSGHIWHYGFDEVTFDGTDWAAVPGGRFGDSLDPNTHANNTAEAGNGPTGIQGNGVDVDILNEGLTIQPAPDNVVIWMRDEPVEGGSPPVRPTFFYLNGVDGTCI